MEIKISKDQNAIQVKDGGEVKQLKFVEFDDDRFDCSACYFRKIIISCKTIPCTEYYRLDNKRGHFTEAK